MNVLLTATVQSHICQFHLPLIRALKEHGCRVEVAANNNLSVKPGLSLDEADQVYDIPFQRSPFQKSNLTAYKKMKQLLSEHHYDIIHCNTPMGACITRLAARKARKKGTRVIYTAHGFHFFKGAPLKNWLLYFPMEWILSFLTDTLLCINSEDFRFAKRHLHAKSTEYVRGVGFDRTRCNRSKSKAEARLDLGIPAEKKMLFSIGELNKRKNHEVIFRALSELNDPDIIWYIAGNGPLEDYLKNLAKECHLENNVVFLGYNRHISTYFEAADLFVFPSLQEGLPLALMETMSFGLPVVASNIRGTNDLITDGIGGYLVDKYDVPGFAEKIRSLLNDTSLSTDMTLHNKEVIKEFEIVPVLEQMKQIYNL